MFAVFLEFILGATFPGRNMVGMSYMIEFCLEPTARETIVQMYMYYKPYLTLFTTVFYQFLSKNTLALQTLFLLMAIFNTIYIIMYMPESPEWLYKTGKFQESKMALKKVA